MRRRFRRCLFRAIPGLAYHGEHWIVGYRDERGQLQHLEGPRRAPALPMHGLVKQTSGAKSPEEMRALLAEGKLSERRKRQLLYYEKGAA